MDKRVREVLFEPLRKNILSAIIPDLVFKFDNREISTPAQLVRDDDEFKFTLHFNTGEPPAELQALRGGFFNDADKKTVRGQINGEISFRCDDVFPPSTMTTRSRGTSITVLTSHRMHLVPEGTDAMTTRQVQKLIGQSVTKNRNKKPFSALLIYHGPKLKMRDGGTEIIMKNKFLGERSSSTADLHQFESNGWKGALIQEGSELHLHLMDREESDANLSSQQVIDLIDRASQAVGFVLGFHPWPAYREVRIDHKIFERWISPRFDLPTTYLTPVSEAMWTHFLSDRANPFHRIIPTIIDGMGRLSTENRKKLAVLLRHFRSADTRTLPASTRLLILCAVLDGLTKLISGARNTKKAGTEKTWKRASAKAGLSWDRGKKLFLKFGGNTGTY